MYQRSLRGIKMSEIDFSLPSKFVDACVAKDEDNSLKIAKLIAKQHNVSLEQELQILSDTAAIALSIDEMTAVFTMVEDIRKHEV